MVLLTDPACPTVLPASGCPIIFLQEHRLCLKDRVAVTEHLSHASVGRILDGVIIFNDRLLLRQFVDRLGALDHEIGVDVDLGDSLGRAAVEVSVS